MSRQKENTTKYNITPKEPPAFLDQAICEYAKNHSQDRGKFIHVILRCAALLVIGLSTALLYWQGSSEIDASSTNTDVNTVAVADQSKESASWDEIEADIIALELEMSFTENESILATSYQM